MINVLRVTLLIFDTRHNTWLTSSKSWSDLFLFLLMFVSYYNPRMGLVILDWRAWSLFPSHSSDIFGGINFVVKDTAVVENILNF